jgi:5-methylcytosine-specific restriction enzyme A
MGAKRRQFGRGYDRSRWATNPPPAHLYAYGGSWPVIRKEVLERDRFECQLRFPVICFGRATQVDHIVRPEEGGTNDLANLRAVCKPCHARRTGQQGALAKQRRAARRRE